MSSKKIILQKNNHAAYMQKSVYEAELDNMQSFVDWFNRLHYVTPITEVETAKKFLRSTKSYHDAVVLEFLKTKMPELPPNIEPLKQMYNISDCDSVDFSEGNTRFGYLEFAVGKLQYAPSVYAEIDAACTVIATTEQAAALTELNRLWSNLEQIGEVLHPDPGSFRNLYLSECRSLLNDLFYQRRFNAPDEGMQIQWKINILDKLAKAGFGQSITKSK